MTIVGRSQYSHPALGDVPGVALHAQIESIYTKISNDIPGRYATFTQANSAVFDIVHDYGVAIEELGIYLYSGTWPTLTAINNYQGLAAPWAVVATPGNTLRSLRFTAPSSGGPHTGAVVILHDKSAEVKAPRTMVDVSANANLKNKILYRADSTGGAITLTLPAPSEGLFISIKDVGGMAETNNISIAPNGAENIDGSPSDYLIDANYMSISVISDGTDYFIF